MWKNESQDVATKKEFLVPGKEIEGLFLTYGGSQWELLLAILRSSKHTQNRDMAEIKN